MNRKFFYAAIAAVVLFACEKVDVVKQTPEGEATTLKIVMASEPTKASGEGGDEERAISSYQVLIYDMSSRMLEAYATPAPTSTSVNMRCTTGPKEVIVLANAPDVSSIVSYDTFLKTKSSLADNAIGALVMEGNASPNLTAAGGSITVAIRRVVSKVVLDGITTDFELDAYDEMDFIIKKIYLTNVAADKNYLTESPEPASWYNKIVQTSNNDVDAMIYDKVSDVNIKDTKTYTTRHHFYCYPNPYKDDTFSSDSWTPRPTRLVVEAELGGVLYYYPVSLPELKQNVRYYVSLKIIRPGATSPEQDMDKYAVTFNIEIEDWDGPEDVSETI